MDIFAKNKPILIIVSKDYSGLGFAKMTVDAGFDCLLAYKNDDLEEDDQETFDMVGEGMIEKVKLDELFKARAQYKAAYWIFDQNNHSEYSEKLRKEGFKVFGGMKLTDDMEHDRHFGTDLAKKAGLDLPETFEFSDIENGLEHLDQNLDKAYVFKPDEAEGAWTTFVPDSEKDDEANRELYRYMTSQGDDVGTYILQERKKGIEVNIEYWVYRGKPILCYANLECKRKLDFDEGEMCGCSQDIAFIVPIDCKLALETVGKLLKVMPPDYTGFLDSNIIVADRNYYFLEFCARYGYNAHPNLFLTLALESFPKIMTDWMDGNVKNFKENFRQGFGASILCYIDHPKKGYPIIIPEDIENKFFHFDTYKNEEGEYCLAGYANEVGIITAHDHDIKSAGMLAIKNADKISYPNHAIRHDIDKEEYQSSPFKRYIALESMKAFGRPND